MSIGERDPHTGHMTTGHEWNGIKELNTHVPKIVWACLTTAFIIALIMWILLPTWPLGKTYTKGILGFDEKAQLAQSLQKAQKVKADFLDQILDVSYDDIKSNEQLLTYVRRAGKTLYMDNCFACHGADAMGGAGYPNLLDDAWLWHDEETIEQSIAKTLQVGINSQHEDTRIAEMTAFGRNGTLKRDEINAVIDYIVSINASLENDNPNPTNVDKGNAVFEANCVSCHGDDGKGDSTIGVPNLTDAFWIYGNSRQALLDTLIKGRKGWMPAWEQRLSDQDRKLLTLYVMDLKQAK